MNQLLIEQRMPLASITGEPDAYGTADAVVLCDDELCIVDLKFGMGESVDARDNPQLQIYALAALEMFSPLGDFSTVRMVIHQPRLRSVSEWSISVAELREFGVKARAAADAARQPHADLVPSKKGCRWCRAKATCPALAQHCTDVFQAVKADSSTPPADLSKALAEVDLIGDWCNAVRAEAERRLLAGDDVPGFKVVEGRKPGRKWSDETSVEMVMATVGVDPSVAYERSLVSPTTAGKLAKSGAITPEQWGALSAHITQAAGKPTVVPESDKRESLVEIFTKT